MPFSSYDQWKLETPEDEADRLARYSRRRKRSWRQRADDRIADRIDGYDRDDLGESPDF